MVLIVIGATTHMTIGDMAIILGAITILGIRLIITADFTEVITILGDIIIHTAIITTDMATHIMEVAIMVVMAGEGCPTVLQDVVVCHQITTQTYQIAEIVIQEPQTIQRLGEVR